MKINIPVSSLQQIMIPSKHKTNIHLHYKAHMQRQPPGRKPDNGREGHIRIRTHFGNFFQISRIQIRTKWGHFARPIALSPLPLSGVLTRREQPVNLLPNPNPLLGLLNLYTCKGAHDSFLRTQLPLPVLSWQGIVFLVGLNTIQLQISRRNSLPYSVKVRTMSSVHPPKKRW